MTAAEDGAKSTPTEGACKPKGTAGDSTVAICSVEMCASSSSSRPQGLWKGQREQTGLGWCFPPRRAADVPSNDVLLPHITEATAATGLSQALYFSTHRSGFLFFNIPTPRKSVFSFQLLSLDRLVANGTFYLRTMCNATVFHHPHRQLRSLSGSLQALSLTS